MLVSLLNSTIAVINVIHVGNKYTNDNPLEHEILWTIILTEISFKLFPFLVLSFTRKRVRIDPGVSLEAGNRRKSQPTLSELTSYCRLVCLYLHSNYEQNSSVCCLL